MRNPRDYRLTRKGVEVFRLDPTVPLPEGCAVLREPPLADRLMTLPRYAPGARGFRPKGEHGWAYLLRDRG